MKKRQKRFLWRVALFVSVSVLGGVGFVCGVFPSYEYHARAYFKVNDPAPSFLYSSDSIKSNDQIAAEFLGLLDYDHVLDTALRDMQLKGSSVFEGEYPSQWISKRLKAKYRSDSGIITLSLRGGDPAKVTVILNGLVDVLQEEMINEEKKGQVYLLNDLKDMIDNKEQEINSRRSRYAFENGYRQEPDLANLRAEKSQVEIDLIKSRVRLQKLESRKAVTETIQNDAAIGNPEMTALELEVEILEAELTALNDSRLKAEKVSLQWRFMQREFDRMYEMIYKLRDEEELQRMRLSARSRVNVAGRAAVPKARQWFWFRPNIGGV